MLTARSARSSWPGGGIINADAGDLLVAFAELVNVPVIPTLMGWGCLPDDHPLMAGHGRAYRRRTATATRRCSSPTSCSASATGGPTGTPAAWRPTARVGRSSTSTSSPPRSAGCSHPTTASSPTPRRRSSCSSRPRSERMPGPGSCRTSDIWVKECQERKRTMLRRTHFDDVPIKPQRVYEEMNRAFRPGDPVRQHDRAVPDRGRAVPAHLPAPPLDQRRPGRAARLDGAGRDRRLRRRPRRDGGGAVGRLRLPVR